MPHKEYPNNIYLNETAKLALRQIIGQVLSNLKFYKNENIYFLDDEKKDMFQVCIQPDQAIALQKLFKKLQQA